MAEWARSSLRPILLAIVSRLAEITEIASTRVILTVLPPDEVPPFGAPQDVLVRVRGEHPDEAAIDGTGRWHNLRHRSLDVACRSRVSLDEAGRDYYRLTDETLGHVLLEDLVVEALELFNVPGDNDDLLTAPLRVGRLTDPQRMKAPHHEWVFSVFSVDVTYVRDLDTELTSQFDS